MLLEPFGRAGRQRGRGGGGVDDREGFHMFYDACRDELHAAVAVTLGDPQLAVEAVDEAFVRAAERW